MYLLDLDTLFMHSVQYSSLNVVVTIEREGGREGGKEREREGERRREWGRGERQ